MMKTADTVAFGEPINGFSVVSNGSSSSKAKYCFPSISDRNHYFRSSKWIGVAVAVSLGSCVSACGIFTSRVIRQLIVDISFVSLGNIVSYSARFLSCTSRFTGDVALDQKI